MAECQRQDIEVKVERIERRPGYALTLTEQEAVTLLRVLNRVRGHSEKSDRKHANAIALALIKVGVWAPSDPLDTWAQGLIHIPSVDRTGNPTTQTSP
jgi:hypothetical protein